MTFPLPLVPFEYYMLADSSPEYPRVFVIEILLSGTPMRDALEAAWKLALARHPLLHSCLAKGAGRSWQWEPAGDTNVAITWMDDEHSSDSRAEEIDLLRRTGVSLLIRTNDDKTRLTLIFHHACCDGMGGLQFIGDF